jgi:hypothetical protein
MNGVSSGTGRSARLTPENMFYIVQYPFRSHCLALALTISALGHAQQLFFCHRRDG